MVQRITTAKTKTTTDYIFDLQYADDAALTVGLKQNLTTVTTTSVESAALLVNTKKTDMMINTLIPLQLNSEEQVKK